MINLSMAEPDNMLRPRISVVGVGGAGGNAINNMIRANLEGCDFIAANTDAQALAMSLAGRKLQLGLNLSRGLGAGSKPNVGRDAAEEQIAEIQALLEGSDMLFVTAGMGGGTGTGAAPVIARVARESGILTVGVVTKPFHFEGTQRMRQAEAGIAELQKYVDTLIVIPNQNLFRIANERTTIAEAFRMADEVLHSGVRGITDLMVMPGFMNLDFADVKTVMGEMGKAMMGTGEADGDNRAIRAAEAAISNPLLDDISMKGARGVLINVTGGLDMTLFEMDQAANRIREEVDAEAQIKVGSTLDENISGRIRVSVIATGIDAALVEQQDKNRAAGSAGGGSSGARGLGATQVASAPSPVRVVAAETAAQNAQQAARSAAPLAAPSMAASMPDVAPRASVPVPPRNVTVNPAATSSTSINLSTSYFTTQTPVAAQVVARHRQNETAQAASGAQGSARTVEREPDLLDQAGSYVGDSAQEAQNHHEARTVAAATAAMETMAELTQEDDLHHEDHDQMEVREAVNAGPSMSATSSASSMAGTSAARRDVAPTMRGNGYSSTPASVSPASFASASVSPASRGASAAGRPVSSAPAGRVEAQNAPRDMRMTQLTTGAPAAQSSSHSQASGPTVGQMGGQVGGKAAQGAGPVASSHVNPRSQSLFQRITGFGIARPSASRDDDDFDDTPVAQPRAAASGEADQADLLEIPAFLRRQTNH